MNAGARGEPRARVTVEADAAEWLLAASDDPGRVRLQWASGGGLADLPVGPVFDLVRMCEDIGTAVIQALRRRDAAGPVMLATASHVLSFLVPPGAAADWKVWLAGTEYARRRTVAAAGPGRVLRCPRPGCVRQGHSWLIRPGVPLTDSHILRAALQEAIDRPGLPGGLFR
ncbi:hypothetical protein VT50_0232870 [Streptomyces antioxidans]|uniref:DNA primase/polymerase bifunctional N-terminal domain-containing protein n=1 Tax=Streptomyces antioxidans TaxID=1507734 RepID=A0A1V4CVD9_9ACTN|nr:hypothetical protein [Streptomyces antioxidans]OPF71525.1 hypothetical protein VT50_0232870 [Streptomyces antioxidans]